MSHPTKRRAAQELLMCVLVWGILWVSGKNMGESARLWIFLMPLVVALAAVSLEKLRQQPNGAFLIGMMFLIQASVCVLTVIRIDGFHFAELL